ncbi:hypothetical protein SRHO_G00101020 [Serrasalmus rhombeus]
MCEAYKAYFGMPVGDQDKPWAPHFTCEHCKKTLEVPHCPELPVPTPPDRATPPSEESSRSDTQTSSLHVQMRSGSHTTLTKKTSTI